MDCIRPGGVAVHTTEYNVSSNRRTVDNDATVLFRQRDVKWLVSQLRILGHSVTDPDLRAGAGPADRHIDAPPYSKTHLKVEIAEHVATSLGLVAEKAAVVPRSRPWRTDLLLQTRMGKSRLIHSFRNTSSETSRLYLARRVIRRGLRETEQAWRQLNERLTRVWPSKAEIGPSHPPFENIAAYLIWRTLTGDRVVDVCWTNGTGRLAALALCGKDVLGLDVGQGPSSGGHRAQPLVCGRLVQLPLRTNHADIVSVFDLLQTLDPADVKGAVDELERVSARYVFATIPSFGVDTLSPPNGSLAGKVQPEHLAFYESLGESYEGPVPLEHVRRSESDPDFPQLCTVASIVWWTRIFEQAGLIRCAGLEQRLVPLLTRFGVYGHWKIYVLRRSDVQEPIGEVHTEVEIAAVEAALGMAAPVSPASSTGPPFRQ
ncbi:MAG: class I SAM-dependent methyltransferase [Acidimicrobiia bacterium]